MFSVFKDLVAYAAENRMWWLLPVIVTIVLVGGLVFLVESSVIAPFIYAMF